MSRVTKTFFLIGNTDESEIFSTANNDVLLFEILCRVHEIFTNFFVVELFMALFISLSLLLASCLPSFPLKTNKRQCFSLSSEQEQMTKLRPIYDTRKLQNLLSCARFISPINSIFPYALLALNVEHRHRFLIQGDYYHRFGESSRSGARYCGSRRSVHTIKPSRKEERSLKRMKIVFFYFLEHGNLGSRSLWKWNFRAIIPKAL